LIKIKSIHILIKFKILNYNKKWNIIFKNWKITFEKYFNFKIKLFSISRNQRKYQSAFWSWETQSESTLNMQNIKQQTIQNIPHNYDKWISRWQSDLWSCFMKSIEKVQWQYFSTFVTVKYTEIQKNLNTKSILNVAVRNVLNCLLFYILHVVCWFWWFRSYPDGWLVFSLILTN